MERNAVLSSLQCANELIPRGGSVLTSASPSAAASLWRDERLWRQVGSYDEAREG